MNDRAKPRTPNVSYHRPSKHRHGLGLATGRDRDDVKSERRRRNKAAKLSRRINR